MSAKPQSLANHARLIPLYHGFVLGVLLINVIWAGVRLWRAPSVDDIVSLLVAVALMVLAVFARVFALRAQDRVIRLEMQLRMRELLPAELQSRIPEFTIDQLVALRFASDDELPTLAAQVLHDKIGDRQAIKKMVRSWRADYLRV